MPSKMLIDASHPEETRVVVVHGSRIEEFDFESQDKKQLKGNIYLARVTRVEPSLQAAFVEYGGNRHGFLAFSEIHPDYYQIPVADRQALLRADAEAAESENDDEEDERQGRGRRRRRGRHRGRNGADGANAPIESSEAGGGAEASTDSHDREAGEQADGSPDGNDAPVDNEPAEARPAMAAASDAETISEPVDGFVADAGDVAEHSEPNGDEAEIESVGAEDALEEVQSRRRPVRRQYKIQEVIKRRQILLVQVVKEERGNKGAALTTYLSLAGRYSVLMPNTARGGGISRKITSAQDRKRLKEVVQELDVPQGMGVILRTAGESRTKAEIKRDYEYLMRLWENVRTLTLQSTAPALVYEEGSLIKRSVRDLYNKDIGEILVSGEDGYREAKDFMRMLMPSHAKVVQPYRDTVPIFVRQGVEAQLDKMLQPQVTLKSGGYIIINQTEALVAIDVNSGRSTREHSIEETALHTNLEAAEEVARQLRLRDLAGLIVIDFIDMEENRNNRSVEKRLKDHLKNDRARIQLGRISHFGLMEMSRQRIRASVLESTMKPCPHCGGTGHVRSDSSVGLLVVRAIEEFLLKDARSHITVRTPSTTAMYVLNHKRSTLTELETRFGLTITFEFDETVGAQHYAISRGAQVEKPVTSPAVVPASHQTMPEDEDEIVQVEADGEDEHDEESTAQQAERPAQAARDDGDGRRKRRRRRRRGGRDREAAAETATGSADVSDSEGDEEEEGEADSEAIVVAGSPDGDRKKRRRGKRGGRRARGDGEAGASAEAHDQITRQDGGREADGAMASAQEGATASAAQPLPVEDLTPPADGSVDTDEPQKPVRARARTRKPKTETQDDDAGAKPAARRSPRSRKAAVADDVAAETPVPEQSSAPTSNGAAATDSVPPADVAEEPEKAEPAPPKPATLTSPAADQPKRSGWWSRKSFF